MITVNEMDRTLYEAEYLTAREVVKSLATFDLDCYSDEELVEIVQCFAEFQEFAVAHSINTAARKPTGEKEHNERLRRWLVSEQH